MPRANEAYMRHAIYYESVACTAETIFRGGGNGTRRGLALFEQEWSNFRQGYLWSAAHWGESSKIAQLCSDYLNVAPYCLDRYLTVAERMRWLETALDAARRIKNRESEGQHQGDLGLCYHDYGEYHNAIELHHKRLIITREIRDRHGEVVTLNNLGNSYRSLASHENPYVQAPRGHPLSKPNIWRAIEHHVQALAVAREIGDRLEECAAWRNLGRACMTLGLYSQSLKYLEQALGIAQTLNSLTEQSYALVNLGMVSKYMGKYRRSIQFYEHALGLQDQIGDLAEKGRLLNSLGAAYNWMGNHQAAINCYQDKLTLAHQIGRPEQEAASLYSLGSEYWDMGDLRRAIEYYHQAISAYQGLQNYFKVADVQVSLGHAYLRNKEKHKATEAFSHARSTFREHHLPTPITLTFGENLLSAPTILLPLIYLLLKFLSVFFPLNSLIANLTLRLANKDGELNKTLKQLDDMIEKDKITAKK